MLKIKKVFFGLIGLSLISSLFLSACSQTTDKPLTETKKEDATQINKLTVYTSFYPLYDFASKIAGDRAEVANLIPPGTEPHDFEPKASDLVNLSEADILIYNGSGFEGWIEKALEALDSTEMQVVNTSEHVQLLTNKETGHVDGDHHGEEGKHPEEVHGSEHKESEHADEHGQVEGIYDPHIWLDPLRAKDIATSIKEAFIKVDSAGKQTYEENYNKLITEFDKLDKEYQEVVKNAKHKEVIVSQAAFGYLTNRYGLKQIAIAGLSPSDEPTQKELVEIISFAKEHNVKYILFETLVSGNVAQMVKDQIGAEALTLNPLEGLTLDEINQGKDYFSVMRENLVSLKTALGSK